MRQKRAISGFITDLGGQVVLQLVTLVATPILLGFTGRTLYGFWLIVMSIVSYLGITEMGLGVSLTRLIAGLDSEKDSDRAEFDQVSSSAFFMFLIAGGILLLIGLAIMPWIPEWFKIPHVEWPVISKTYFIVILTSALLVVMGTFNAIVVGRQRMAAGNICRLVGSLLNVLLAIFFVWLGLGVMGLALAFALSGLFNAIAGFIIAKFSWPGFQIRFSNVRKKQIKRLWQFGCLFQLAKIANTVAVSADPIIIGVVLGTTLVTTYSFTSKLAILFSISLSSKVALAVFPALAQMHSRKEIAKMRKVYVGLCHFAVRISFIGGAYVLIANKIFVGNWVGTEFFGGDNLNYVFVLWIIQDAFIRGSGVVLMAAGEMKEWAVLSIVEAVANIILSVILGYFIGLVGIALASLIARMPVFIGILVKCCRIVELRFCHFLIILFGWGFIRCCLALASALGISCIFYEGRALLFGEASWLWLILFGGMIGGFNVLFFEGWKFFKISSMPFEQRLKKAFISSFYADFDEDVIK